MSRYDRQFFFAFLWSFVYHYVAAGRCSYGKALLNVLSGVCCHLAHIIWTLWKNHVILLHEHATTSWLQNILKNVTTYEGYFRSVLFNCDRFCCSEILTALFLCIKNIAFSWNGQTKSINMRNYCTKQKQTLKVNYVQQMWDKSTLNKLFCFV
jgi:hypothetical protein